MRSAPFFESKVIKGQKAKQPYFIARGMPAHSDWARCGRTEKSGFGRVDTHLRDHTLGANELLTEIHDRMPLIIAPADYERWLSDELDPRDLTRPFPAEPMRMWPISTRVNKPENDDPSILEPIELSAA
jgi:putative SOS response-associated peptidase YedK